MASSDDESSLSEDEPVSSSSSGKYVGGRILSIKLSNFMTYDNVTVNPGPGLNLIIGPNGSGKSTTVCAICLGLGGKPCFAGRQMQLKDFVKFGKKKASIEIKLDDPSRKHDLIIRRIIKSDGTSKYSKNNKDCKESEVRKEIKRFNIQTNNLCQFLPQERVSEFSKMNAVELLESMQQAVGNADLFKYHDELKKLREKARVIEKSISDKESIVTTQKNQNKQSETEAKSYEEIKRMRKKKELLEEHLPLMQYQESRQKLEIKKEQRKDVKLKLQDVKEKLEPLRKQLRIMDGEVNNCNLKIGNGKTSFKVQMRKVKEGFEEISDLQNQIKSSGVQLNMKIEEQKKIAEKITAIQTQINAMEKNLHTQKQLRTKMEAEQNQLSASVEKTEQEISSIDFNLENIKSTLDKYISERQAKSVELEKLNTIENQKLNILRRKDDDTYKSVLWLRDNKHLFKKKIYNPILMELKVHNPENIKFVENHIAFRDLTAFVCEDNEDSKLLVQKLRQERGWAISTVLPPPHELSSYVPKIPVEVMRRKYGLNNYLKDLFTAPDTIMRFLCANYNIHNTPVGNERTEKFIDNIFNDEAFSKFFTADSSNTVRRSKYGERLITMNTVQLKQPEILNKFTDTSESQRELQRDLQNIENYIQAEKEKERNLQAERHKLYMTLEGFRKKKKEYNDLKSAIRSSEFQLKHKNAALTQVKSEVKDIPTLIKDSERDVSEFKEKMITKAAKVQELHKAALKVNMETLEYLILEHALAEKQHDFSTSLEDDQKSVDELSAELKKIEEECAELTRETLDFFNKAEIATKMKINKQNKPTLTSKYADLPHSVAGIQSEIHSINARLKLFGHEINKKTYHDHLARENEIVKNERQLLDFQTNLAELKDTIKTKKNLWLNPLKGLIEKIDDTFGNYMQSLNCSGEVALKVADNPDDFDKYGLNILVKFRDKCALQTLSHARHSGGECSVATIIFILALQKLTDVPFRCVDEINQGMDAINERRIFELVSMSSGRSSQYFLLTPKLLPDLNYPDAVQLHIIQNAPGLKNDMKWDMDSIFQNVKRVIRKH